MPHDDLRADAHDTVASEETLQRGVRADWIDAKGVPTAAALPVADLKDPARKGISVHRKSCAERIDGGHPLAQWSKLIEANAGQVRAIRALDGRQAFDIVAAPTDEDERHALVRFMDPTNPPASPRLERDKLLQVFLCTPCREER